MRANSILKRDGTEEFFQVTFLSHWSRIENMSNPNDTDCVKFCSDGYVSNQKGHSYTIVAERKISQKERLKILGA